MPDVTVVDPVPETQRRLSGLDLGVLWGDLSIGILVLVTGGFLVPALSGMQAMLAIVIGGVIGCAALALVSIAGAREGVPTMVLLRPMLGRRGSFAPSAMNVLQLLGWTAVELWAMGKVANVLSIQVAEIDAEPLWIVVVAVLCGGAAIAGPTRVIRVWLERFGVWALGAAGVWLTIALLTSGGLGEAFTASGTGGFPFWAAVDLVIVMPISWMPLAADYSRFTATGVSAGPGVFIGYLVGNTWFYALGALLVLVGGSADVVGVGGSILALGGGLVALVILLVGETDEAFANIYSTAVSVQNVVPRWSQRRVIIAVTCVATAGALVLVDLVTFETFLFLLGSVFVPLFGVFFVSYFVFGERSVERDGIRWRAVFAWAVGFLVYHWCAPLAWEGWMTGVRTVLHDGLGLPFPLFDGKLGASLPGFVAAVACALVLLRSRRRPSVNSGAVT